MAEAIRCPKCERVVAKPDRGTLEYYDPHFNCKCGYKGKLHWARKKT